MSSIGGVLRSAQLRRVELAWGASIVAEWANFVALGVFAYHVGGTLAVGIAGLVRLLPAALVAPFAAFAGDRFPRERFLVAISAGGCLALAGSAAVYFLDRNEYVIFPLASLFGLSSTLLRPALQALLPSLARTPEELIASNGAASTIEGLATLVGWSRTTKPSLRTSSESALRNRASSQFCTRVGILMLRLRRCVLGSRWTSTLIGSLSPARAES
jgi:hypothetical protein